MAFIHIYFLKFSAKLLYDITKKGALRIAFHYCIWLKSNRPYCYQFFPSASFFFFFFFFAALSITVDCFSNIFPDPNDRMRHIYLCLGLKFIASMNIKRKYINKGTWWRLRIFELRNQYECYKENIDQVDKSFFRRLLFFVC